MTAPPQTLLDSYAIAYAFLFGDDEKLPPMLERQTLGLIEPTTPKGYQRWTDITAANPTLHATATIPLAYTSPTDILLCEAPRAPTLLTPHAIRHLWLHLHIATLIIAATLIPPNPPCRETPPLHHRPPPTPAPLLPNRLRRTPKPRSKCIHPRRPPLLNGSPPPMSRPKTPPFENIPRTAITEWLPKTVDNIAWMAAEVARIAPNDPTHIYAIVISKNGTHAVIAKYKRKPKAP